MQHTGAENIASTFESATAGSDAKPGPPIVKELAR